MDDTVSVGVHGGIHGKILLHAKQYNTWVLE